MEKNQGVSITSSSLEIAYDSHVALRIPNLSLPGKIIAVLGHNGAGKSTLLKSILGLLPPKAGALSVALLGEKARTLVPQEDMSFCPEMGSVFADISVESYIRFWCRVKRKDGKYYLKGGKQYIEALTLPPLMKKLGRELSKGQRRRVQTAIGFLCEPKLFLFDEPFDGLDVQRTGELAQLLQDESDQRSFIVSSHRMDVIERLADTVLVLEKGRVACSGSVQDVCREMGGSSLFISSIEDPTSMSALIRSAYPSLIVNHIGKSLTITGKGIEEHKINALLGKRDLSIERRESSLVDAMNFHLKSVRE